MVLVCDLDNPADSQGHGDIEYPFAVSQTEITNAQYAQFLNAVANTSDKYALYHPKMAIERTEKNHQYTYKPQKNAEKHPVTYIDAPTAMRFVNWLENGRPNKFKKPQDLDDATEVGTYKLKGQITGLSYNIRQEDSHYALINLDEWTKLAYYEPETRHFYDYSDNALPNDKEAIALNCCGKGNHLVNSYSLDEEAAYGAKGLSGNALEILEDFIPAGTFYKKYDDQSKSPTAGGRYVRGSAYDIPESSQRSYLHRAKYKVRPEGAASREELYNVGFRIVYIYEDDAICDHAHDEL